MLLRRSLSPESSCCFFAVFAYFFFSLALSFSSCSTFHATKKTEISQSMGKTGTEKPLKAPKKKQKELDEDDLAALARKKEEQAKLNALKKQVAGGAKLGKGLSKSK